MISKIQKIKLMALSFGFLLSAAGCSPDKNNTQNQDIVRFLWTESITGQAQIKVLNSFGEPIAKARVLIGQAENSPFRGNFLETDQAGTAIIPKEWKNPTSVTVDADGYIRQTLLNQKPGNITLKLNTRYLKQKAELKGQVTQLPVADGDKLIDFGLVMPALSKADILNFDLDQVISPYTDILTVAGQDAPLPSNVSLPKQKEKYFFNLTVEKPIYRIMAPTLGPKRFYAARGRFPFKPVVDELRAGKPFYELLNYFTLFGGGVRDITLVNPSTQLNIPGNELEFKNTLQVQTASAQGDEVMIMLAASEITGTMIPTDVKKSSGSQTLSLTSLADRPAFVVSVIKKQSEFMAKTPGADRMSASILPYTEGIKPSLMSLVADPSILSTDHYAIKMPPAPTKNGIQALATTAVISDLTESLNGDTKITSALRRWEVIGLGWPEQMELPQWPLDSGANKKRVEINFLGSATAQPVQLDDSLIKAATHVSHASTDF